ncbi:DUF6678 family protein [Hymenobacter sp. BRD128]|uniref:DUF6678 family protein n=1 Tax=Hymenobacter sp. BRD128 TaxID=2675878 RepID=UPI00349FB639
MIIPTSGYIETGGQGPWPIRQIQWVEINPIVTEHIGRLGHPKQIDSLVQIEEGLRNATVPYTTMNGIIRILFSDVL